MSKLIRDESIVIRKLAACTKIADCRSDLWDYLGLSSEDVHGQSNEWHRPPYIADVHSEVWVLNAGRVRHFGSSLYEVSQKAELIHPRQGHDPQAVAREKERRDLETDILISELALIRADFVGGDSMSLEEFDQRRIELLQRHITKFPASKR
ncbi:hypothetical protein [Marinobacter shengliensis]|uniref:Uncharacterized protein n=1 Tax=Marinobacter shengliensis TaxID=1389223 RepID=A0ABV4W4D7_9GAMM